MDLDVCGSDALDARAREELRGLWARAFGDRFDDHDADHAFGGVHVLARDSGQLVAHASAVPRSLRFGDLPWRTVGYVEAVATDPARQREGVGRSVMVRLQEEIVARWPVALLSTGRATAFYESLGWERWLGVSYTLVGTEAVLDGEHGGLMVFHAGGSRLDRTVPVTCRDRAGDAW